MSRRRSLQLGILVAAFFVIGCGSSSNVPTTLQGHVWYRGQPLPGGMIVFVPDEERGHTGPLLKAAIQADGSFTVEGKVDAGWYRAAVAPPPTAGSFPTVSEPYPCPPARYRNPQLSGLLAEVKGGCDNVFEFLVDES